MVRAQVTSVRQRRQADMRQTRGIVAKSDKPAVQSVRQLAELTYRARKKLPASAYAIPSKRAYPIHDEAHARNALARVSQFGTPAEKTQVRAAVARRYPNINVGGSPRASRGKTKK